MDSSRLESYFLQYEELDYVIAYGSVGRGETPFVKNTNGKDVLYNDLDLILVTENKTKIRSCLPRIKEDIKELYGGKWVDILVWDKKQLKKKRATIFYFDLCFKYLLLKGNIKSLAQILQSYPQENISTYDFYCMYQTRLWAAMSLLCDEKGKPDFSSRQFKSYQCAKAIIAICDFVLFSYNAYTPMVKDKLENIPFDKNNSTEKFLSLHLTHAIDVKLNPDSQSLYYFIEDGSLVLKLLHIYRNSFLNLLKSRHRIPSLALLNASLKMEVFAVAKAVMVRNPSLLLRNAKRKELHQLFTKILQNANISISIKNKLDALPVLLKELSE